MYVPTYPCDLNNCTDAADPNRLRLVSVRQMVLDIFEQNDVIIPGFR